MVDISLLLVASCGIFAVRDSAPDASHDTSAVRDTAAVRAAAAAHFSEPDTAVQRRVIIRADTAWATVYHGSITFTIIRLRRSPTGWRFDRELGYGIH